MSAPAATRFAQINLSNLPQPAAVQTYSFDAILAARQAYFLKVWAEWVANNPSLPTYNVTRLESNPGFWLQSVDTYREGLVLERINEAVLATSLAYAEGDDLTVRAADFSTERQSGEGDPSLRARAQLAFEALSIGGSYGGYDYMAWSAAPVDIAQVVTYGHEVASVPLGEVRVVLLGAQASGAVPPSAIAAVRATFPRNLRKVNDKINVVTANLVNYAIDATLLLAPGADGPTVQAAQWTQAAAYASARRMIAAPVDFGGVMAAIGANASGLVQGVVMRQPFAGTVDLSNPPVIGGGPFDAPICTSISLQFSQGSSA